MNPAIVTLFQSHRFDEDLQQRTEAAFDTVDNSDRDYLLKVSAEDFADSIVDKLTPELPVLHEDHISCEQTERSEQSENFDRRVMIQRGYATFHSRFPAFRAILDIDQGVGIVAPLAQQLLKSISNASLLWSRS